MKKLLSSFTIILILLCLSGNVFAGTYNIEGKSYSLQITSENNAAVTKLYNKVVKVNCLKDSKQARLFVIKYGGKDWDISNFKITDYKQKNGSYQFMLKPVDDKVPFDVILTAKAEPEQIIWSMELKNTGNKNETATIGFPVLSGLQIGDDFSNNQFMMPVRESGFVSNEREDYYEKPELRTRGYEFQASYGGGCPIQVIDLFDPDNGGGLYLLTLDNTGMDKIMYFDKPGNDKFKGYWPFDLPQQVKNSDNSITMGYIYVEIPIDSGSEFKTPPAAMGFHSSDWHESVGSYRKWLKTWWKPAKSPAWLKDAYIFRSALWWELHGWDFNPAGAKNDKINLEEARNGWGNFPDVKIKEGWANGIYMQDKNRYVIDEYMDWGKKFGGFDAIHMAGTWELGEIGYGWRGDYDGYHDNWGGLKTLRAAVDRMHQLGAKVDEYYEGVLVTKNCNIGREKGKDWAVMSKNSDYPSYFGETFYDMCPSEPGWQDYIAKVAAGRMHDLNLDGVYLDELGCTSYRYCYNPKHTHKNPYSWLRGTYNLFKKVKEEVQKINPDATVRGECWGCDYLLQVEDGTWEQTYNSWGPVIGPLVLPALQALPEVKQFGLQYSGGAQGAINIKKFFFNAMGINSSICDQDSKDLMNQLSKIYKANLDAFTSDNKNYDIGTLVKGIYANRFDGRKSVIYTIYNDLSKTVEGNILKIEHKSGVKYIDQFTGNRIKPERSGKYDLITLSMKSKDIACIKAEKNR